MLLTEEDKKKLLRAIWQTKGMTPTMLKLMTKIIEDTKEVEEGLEVAAWDLEHELMVRRSTLAESVRKLEMMGYLVRRRGKAFGGIRRPTRYYLGPELLKAAGLPVVVRRFEEEEIKEAWREAKRLRESGELGRPYEEWFDEAERSGDLEEIIEDWVKGIRSGETLSGHLLMRLTEWRLARIRRKARHEGGEG